MNSLDVTRINIYAPYKVWSNGEIYRFETDNGIKYLVDFELDSNPYYTAFWFNLTNIVSRFDAEVAMFNEMKP